MLSRSDPDRVRLLEEALEALSEEDSPLRARLLARMALELYYAGEPELRMALSEEAVDIARRIGDPRTLATCLDARHYALWNPENLGYLAAYAAAAISSGDIKGKVGESFKAGKLGTYKIIKGAGGPEVVLGPPFLFNKKNVAKFKF